jgi:hypothetical protein
MIIEMNKDEEATIPKRFDEDLNMKISGKVVS